MSQSYGVLRVVRPSAVVTTKRQDKYSSGWLLEERPIYMLTQRETTIGRALNNDLVLIASSVSREHARLVLDEQGWRIFNMSEHNVVQVNSCTVPHGESSPLYPQDFLVIGGVFLQLVAPCVAPSDGQKSHTSSSNGVPKQMSSFVRTVDEPTTGLWDNGVDNLLGVNIQFALSRSMKRRTLWLIAGICLTVLLISVLVTVMLNSLIGIGEFTRAVPSNILLALTVPIIPAIGITLLVNFIDRFKREPWFLRLAAFLWGAVIAIPPAFFIEVNVDQIMVKISGSHFLLSPLYQGLSVGVTEETVKGLGLLLLFVVLRDEFDNVTDGIAYGALIGAGFAMVENFRYFTMFGKEFLPSLIVGRLVLGWLCHSTFTVCFGAALGYVRHTRVRWQQIVVPLLGYLCAVGLHSAFDFISFLTSNLVLNYPGNSTVAFISLIANVGDYLLPFIAQIVLLYILIKAFSHEGAVIREFLVSEVCDGVVLVDEYALLQNSAQRSKEERRVLRQQGFKQWIRVKKLYQEQIGLAFHKWHVSMGDKSGYLQPEDACRRRIKSLRQEIAEAVPVRNQSRAITSSP